MKTVARGLDMLAGGTIGAALVHGDIGMAVLIVILYGAGLLSGLIHGVEEEA